MIKPQSNNINSKLLQEQVRPGLPISRLKCFGVFLLEQNNYYSCEDISQEVLQHAWDKYLLADDRNVRDSWRCSFELESLCEFRALIEKYPFLSFLCDWWEQKVIATAVEVLNPRNLRHGVTSNFSFTMAVNNYVGYPSDISFCWDDFQCQNAEYAHIPHITSPFVLKLIMWSCYSHWTQRVLSDEEYRKNVDTSDIEFSLRALNEISIAPYSKQDYFLQYAISPHDGLRLIGVGIGEDQIDEDNLPKEWFIAQAQQESDLYKKNEAFIKKTFKTKFANSILKWYREYISFLVERVRTYQGYQDFSVQDSPLPTVKIIPEYRALKTVDPVMRKVAINLIRSCTAKDVEYGRLLYKLQSGHNDYGFQFFTTTLQQKQYYQFMKQFAGVEFAMRGDYSNCVRGYNMEKTAHAHAPAEHANT